jgi:hypothetical protein
VAMFGIFDGVLYPISSRVKKIIKNKLDVTLLI